MTNGILDKSKECFDKLSMNGLVSRLSPFVLSVSKDSERVFSAKLLNLHSPGGH